MHVYVLNTCKIFWLVLYWPSNNLLISIFCKCTVDK